MRGKYPYRLVVTTRWLSDGALAQGADAKATRVVKTWEKPSRRGESDTGHLARVREDARWYVETPSPYYAGSTVEIQRRDEYGEWATVEEVTRVTYQTKQQKESG